QKLRGVTSYISNAYPLGVADGGGAHYPKSFGDKGTSQTVLFAESWARLGAVPTPETSRAWAPHHPNNRLHRVHATPAVQSGVPPENADLRLVNLAAHGGLVGMGDGSVRFISPNATSVVFAGKDTFNWACAVPVPGPGVQPLEGDAAQLANQPT